MKSLVSHEDKMKQFGFSFDISRCSGCMACVVACMDQNDLSAEGPSYRSVIHLEKGRYPQAMLSFVSLACFHCGDAPCLKVCPMSAISSEPERGLVLVNDNLCIGCRACAMVCPYGAPQFRPGQKMTKCDFCEKRVSQGLEPACVRTCTTRALGYGPLETLAREKVERAAIKILESFSVQFIRAESVI
jgi:DMSO reductase iron-sulfur subunit